MISSMKDRTKVLFAQHLMEMLRETTLDKVRVTELARRSGTAPQTFYYHFKDKYELVAWMYLKDFSDVVGHEQPGYSPERIAAIMQKMDEKRPFYRKVFSADAQNSISSYVRQLSIRLAREAMAGPGKTRELTARQELAIQYHAYGVLGLLQEWILSKEPMPTLLLAEFMYSKTPDDLKQSFGRMEYRSDHILRSKLS